MKFTTALMLAAGIAAGAPAITGAQEWPQQPVRLIVPFPAGGTPDSNARNLARQLEIQLGQPVVVENKAGANGIIGMDAVAKAKPDGYNFLYSTPAFAINPSAYKKLPFNAQTDFVPVTNVANSDGYLVLVNANVPARSMRELITLATPADSKISYGSAGTGNSTHLAAELLNLRAQTHMLHVPFKGIQPAMTALLGNDVQVMLVSPTAALQHVKSGRLRALAYTGTTRWKGAPELPTVNETIAGYEFTGSWHGLLAPAGTSPAVVAKLRAEVARAVENPKLKEYLESGGYEPVANTPAAFKTFIDAEIRKYAELVKAAGITPE